jgi:hypothetical protein
MSDVSIIKGRRRAVMTSETSKGYVWMLANLLHCQTANGVAFASFDLEVIDEVAKDFIRENIEVEYK